jgi:putative ATP-binding cassette transporter
LEDRSIYVFDEWAADQDVEWRRYFYRTLLPQMKGRGKLIIAITHDEGYDDVPDRTLHFHDGRLSCIETREA